jgi:centrosomal protein CEP112
VQFLRCFQSISELEGQISELREELVQANQLRKQQLVELGLLREEEKQKMQRDHETEVHMVIAFPLTDTKAFLPSAHRAKTIRILTMRQQRRREVAGHLILTAVNKVFVGHGTCNMVSDQSRI